jgi:hypothetical protein
VPRREYYHDDTAPPANSMTPTAFAAVRDDQGRVLLVRRGEIGRTIVHRDRFLEVRAHSDAELMPVTDHPCRARTVAPPAGIVGREPRRRR